MSFYQNPPRHLIQPLDVAPACFWAPQTLRALAGPPLPVRAVRVRAQEPRGPEGSNRPVGEASLQRRCSRIPGVPKRNTPCRPDVPFVVENTCHRDHCPVHNLQTANPGLRVDGGCDALLQPGDGIWRSEMETPPLPLRLHPAAAGELSTGAPRALGTTGGHRATADTGSHALTR